MAINVRPLHDLVIVERTKHKEKTGGGIIIPDNAKEKPREGKIVAVGRGKREGGKLRRMGLKKGEHVLFEKYAGTEIRLNGRQHLILREDDILGVVDSG